MKRSVVILAAVAVPVARADTRSPAPVHCYVHNNSDHEIRLSYEIPVNDGQRVDNGDTITDGNQKLQISCTQDESLKLVGTYGALSIVHLPPWFAASDYDGEVRVTAKKKGAVVEVDGKPVTLVKGVAKQRIDARAKLLASDPDMSLRRGKVAVDVKATAGGEVATLTVPVSAFTERRRLLAELLNAARVPVPWATSTDHTGPAIVFGCVVEPPRPNRIEDHFDLFRSPSSVAALSLVATCAPVWVKVETCPRSTDEYLAKDPPIARYRIDSSLTLVEAKTGKLVATTTLEGDAPGRCRNLATKPIAGAVASSEAVLRWLDTVK